MELKVINFDVTKIFNVTDSALAELKKKYTSIVITNAEEYKVATKGRAEIREIRVGVEKKRKEVKAPILKMGNDLDAEAERVTIALEDIENPLDDAIKAYDAKKLAEKLEKERIENERKAAIMMRIDEVRNFPLKYIDKPSIVIKNCIEHLSDCAAKDVFDYQEFSVLAHETKAAAITTLSTMFAERQKIELEKIEAEQRRKEQEAEKARLEAERRRIADEQAQHERLMAEERKKLLDAEAERQKAIEADRKQIADELAKIEAKRRAQEEAQFQAMLEQEAEQKRINDSRIELEKALKKQEEDAEFKAKKAAEQKAAEEAEIAKIEKEWLERASQATSINTDSEIVSLAKLALNALDAQQIYFKEKTQEALLKSKTLSKELREKAALIISGAK